MKEFVRINDNISYLKGTISSNIYYFDFEKKAIIDTGDADDIIDNIIEFKKQGIDLTKLDYIITTHSHGDHVGGNRYLKQLNPKIKIIGSLRYYSYQDIRKKVNLFKGAEREFDEYDIDIIVKEDDIIDIGGCNLKVYETPGHTLDSISLYLEKDKWLFSGDLIYPGVVSQIDYYQDIIKSVEQLIESYNKIENLNCISFFTGHGKPVHEINNCFIVPMRKLKKFHNNPMLAFVNNLVILIEFYLYKFPDKTVDDIQEYIINNFSKVDYDPIIKALTNNQYIELINKAISLLLILKKIRLEENRIYLLNEINYTL